MKLVLLFVVLGVAAALDTKAAFNEFKAKYNKNYSSPAEEQLRMQIFETNLARAEELNQREPAGGATFGVTKFSDLTPEEFTKNWKGYTPARGYPSTERPKAPQVPSPCSSASCDWRKANAVTPVKNQGACGSCWAFSATEGVESFWFLSGNTLPVLAPQQLVSCDKVDGGCNGGDLPTAFKYVEQTKGLESEASYPYTSGGSGKNGACQFQSSKIVASMKNWTYAIQPCFDACKNQNENALRKVVAATGPSSICVNANPWQFYSKGVLKGTCGGAYTQLDHCVQLVGYQASGVNNYWIVRNSWAEDWGEQGYIYIEMGKNLCGVADEATFVIG